ncbi:uncharacterized protein LOC107264602 isoform X2 [Cephus cinctus]|uniref:Gustatory receptor n=1 Tax=Cephus cinctus TaxID=211228 RepID=A0AAJ7VYA3_CEPCN|nr:uncharacterized protein LOC107264602 isoform X2 [Cephus cinctus]
MESRNLYQTLKPTFYTASLLGMIPWMRIKKTESNCEKLIICEASRIQWIYVLLEIVLLLCLLYPKWLYVTTTEMFNLTNISSLFEFIIPYSLYFGLGTICTLTLIRAEHQVALIDKIIKIDQKLDRNFKLDMNYKKVQRMSVLAICLPVIVYIIIVILDIYSFKANIYTTLLIVIEIIYLVEFPFYYGCLVKMVCRWVKFMTLILQRKIRESQEIPQGIDFCQNDIKALRDVYNNVSDVVAGINKEYGIQIAQRFILNHISLPYYSYFFYLMIKEERGVLPIIDTVIWLGIFALPVVYVAVNCESVNRASLKMAYVVHKAIRVVPGTRTKIDVGIKRSKE